MVRKPLKCQLCFSVFTREELKRKERETLETLKRNPSLSTYMKDIECWNKHTLHNGNNWIITQNEKNMFILMSYKQIDIISDSFGNG